MGLDEFNRTETTQRNTTTDNEKYKDGQWLRQKYNDGFSQKDIAEKCGVSRQTIMKYFKKYDIDTTRKKYTRDELLDILKENPDITSQILDEPSNDYPSKWVYENRFDSLSRAKEIAGIGGKTIQCHNCGKRYRKISRHWYETDCNYPDLTQKQKSILIGLMMGDATLAAKRQKNPCVNIVNTNLDFLNWIESRLEGLCYGPKLISTAEEKYQDNIKRGFTTKEKANIENYNDVYFINTVSHKDFTVLDWIEGESKIIPENIPMNSMIVKMWYCSDGSLHWRPNINKAESRITNVTEKDNLSKFKRMFSRCGIDVRIGGKEIMFNQKETEKLLKWLGKPPDGMEYKWEWENRQKYKEKKRKKI